MFRAFTFRFERRVSRALSALTGNTYPPAMSAKLSALGFNSELWLTEKQMAVVGVQVADAHKGKGYLAQLNDTMSLTLYNASQTTDPERVAKMIGRFAVYDALTRERIRGGAESTLREHTEKFHSNEWLSDRDVDMLSLKLKPDAKPIQVSYEFQETVAGSDGASVTETRTVTRGYYNHDQLESGDALTVVRKILPISVSTGRRYKGNSLRMLVRIAMERGYQSPHWLTMQTAQALGVLIKSPDMGVDINVGEHKVVTLYNATETTDAGKVASAAYNARFSPRSGVTGAMYPPHSQVVLKAVALKKNYRSVYWLTKKQASVIGVNIRDNEESTSVMTDTGAVELYNAEQTTAAGLIEKRFGSRS